MSKSKRTIAFRVISLSAVLFTMVAIFMFSAENGKESSKTSDGVTAFVVKTVVKDYDKMTPQKKESVLQKFSGFVRTLAHFSIFAALGFFTANLLNSFGIAALKRWLFSILFSFVYAVSDEIHQIFVPGRAFQLSDIAVDTLGVVLGVTVFAVILIFARFLKRKFSNDKKV